MYKIFNEEPPKLPQIGKRVIWRWKTANSALLRVVTKKNPQPILSSKRMPPFQNTNMVLERTKI
jgi:hypothetical protein